MRDSRHYRAAIVAAATGMTAMAAASAHVRAADITDCFADLERGTGAQIVCDFPLQPSPKEKAELEKQTYGYLKDAACTVSIRIDRAQITAAIETPNYVFEAPPQPVTCNVTTPTKAGDQVIPITATFAPKVTIKDGAAVLATPGLGDVKGVSRVLSLPVVAYVNRAAFLRTGMVKVVNAWLGHMRKAPVRTATP